MNLNLGAGNRILDDSINHDITRHSKAIDVAWDLNDLPWPWEDGQFARVYAFSVLEHLYHNLLTSMDEIWRITELGGLCVVKLPFWKANVTWEDLTHIHKVGPGIMDQLDPTTQRGRDYGFYTPYKWHVLKRWANKKKRPTSFYWNLIKKPEGWDGT